MLWLALQSDEGQLARRESGGSQPEEGKRKRSEREIEKDKFFRVWLMMEIRRSRQWIVDIQSISPGAPFAMITALNYRFGGDYLVLGLNAP